MGCGCSRTSLTENNSKGIGVFHPVEGTRTRAGSKISPGSAHTVAAEESYTRRKSYNVIVKKDEILVRFNRKGEVMDFYSRDSLRPGRVAEMLQAYGEPRDAQTEVWPAPSQAPQVTATEPRYRLELEHVYGYQCYAARQNLYYLTAEEVLYPCGSLAVVHNKTTNSQRYIGGGSLETAKGHTDDIIALAISAKKDLIATGDAGFNPLICVWRVGSYDQPIHEFDQGLGSRGVGILSFSSNNKFLAAVDISSDQNIRVFDLKQKTLFFTEKGYPGHMYSLGFNPKDLVFCSVGISHIFFWSKNSKGFSREKGTYGSLGPECSMSTLQWLNGTTCITAGHNGKIYQWENTHLVQVQQVCSGSQELYVLAISSEFIVTGGQDSKLHVMDLSLKKLKSIDMPDWLRAVDICGGTVICSTRNGVITEVSSSGQKVIMETHCEGEVWSLAAHPTNPNLVISTGDDNKIKMWDIARKRCVATFTIEVLPVQNTAHRSSLLPSSQQSRAVATSPIGHVAVGHNDGHVSIRNASELETVLFALSPSRAFIRCLQYSPSGRLLAVGSTDGSITLYDANHSYDELAGLESCMNPISSLDWSVDGKHLKACSQDGELKFYAVETGDCLQDGKALLKDEQWASWTSHKGWPVQGLAQMPSEDPFLTCVVRANQKPLVAVGNCWGIVELYTYPNGSDATAHSSKAHSLEVANAIWMNQDTTLVTTGGHDLALMQWKVVALDL